MDESCIVFPYTTVSNTVFEKSSGVFENLCLINLNKPDALKSDVGLNLYSLPLDIGEEVYKMSAFYENRIAAKMNTDYFMEFYGAKDDESLDSILKGMNLENCAQPSFNRKKIIESGFYLKLMEKYLEDQREIEETIAKVDEKNQILFDSILKREDSLPLENKKIKQNNLPLRLLEKFVFSWFTIFGTCECIASSFITDDKVYLDILNDAGMEFQEKGILPVNSDFIFNITIYESASMLSEFYEKNDLPGLNDNLKRTIKIYLIS